MRASALKNLTRLKWFFVVRIRLTDKASAVELSLVFLKAEGYTPRGLKAFGRMDEVQHRGQRRRSGRHRGARQKHWQSCNTALKQVPVLWRSLFSCEKRQKYAGHKNTWTTFETSCSTFMTNVVLHGMRLSFWPRCCCCCGCCCCFYEMMVVISRDLTSAFLWLPTWSEREHGGLKYARTS